MPFTRTYTCELPNVRLAGATALPGLDASFWTIWARKESIALDAWKIWRLTLRDWVGVFPDRSKVNIFFDHVSYVGVSGPRTTAKLKEDSLYFLA